MNRHGSSRDRLMRVSKAIKMQGKKNVEFIDRTKRRFVHICQEPNKKKKKKGKEKTKRAKSGRPVIGCASNRG